MCSICSMCSMYADTFTQANTLYRQAQYNKALELYTQIPSKSASVHYNMGNCAYKLKRYGYALLYWRRAEHNWGIFHRDELIENITLLQEQLGLLPKKRNPIIRLGSKIKQFLTSLIKAIPLIFIQLLFLLLWLFLFLYLRFLYKTKQKTIIAILFAIIAFCGIVLITKYSMNARTYGVVLKQTPLLSGPSQTYQTLMTLKQAQEFIIKQEEQNFFKVKVLKRIGWIAKGDTAKI